MDRAVQKHQDREVGLAYVLPLTLSRSIRVGEGSGAIQEQSATDSASLRGILWLSGGCSVVVSVRSRHNCLLTG